VSGTGSKRNSFKLCVPLSTGPCCLVQSKLVKRLKPALFCSLFVVTYRETASGEKNPNRFRPLCTRVWPMANSWKGNNQTNEWLLSLVQSTEIRDTHKNCWNIRTVNFSLRSVGVLMVHTQCVRIVIPLHAPLRPRATKFSRAAPPENRRRGRLGCPRPYGDDWRAALGPRAANWIAHI